MLIHAQFSSFFLVDVGKNNYVTDRFDVREQKSVTTKACFPLGEFVRANREKSNLIGWRQTLTTSPANHIRFLLVRANKFAKWKTGLTKEFQNSAQGMLKSRP